MSQQPPGRLALSRRQLLRCGTLAVCGLATYTRRAMAALTPVRMSCTEYRPFGCHRRGSPTHCSRLGCIGACACGDWVYWR